MVAWTSRSCGSCPRHADAVQRPPRHRGDRRRRDEVAGHLAWRLELCTTAGLLHGGVVMALADSLGGICAFLNLPGGDDVDHRVEDQLLPRCAGGIGACDGAAVARRADDDRRADRSAGRPWQTGRPGHPDAGGDRAQEPEGVHPPAILLSWSPSRAHGVPGLREVRPGRPDLRSRADPRRRARRRPPHVVWVEGVATPIIASRTERTILHDMGEDAATQAVVVDEALDLAQRLATAAEAGRVDLGDLGRRARHLLESTTRGADSDCNLGPDASLRRRRAPPAVAGTSSPRPSRCLRRAGRRRPRWAFTRPIRRR